MSVHGVRLIMEISKRIFTTLHLPQYHEDVNNKSSLLFAGLLFEILETEYFLTLISLCHCEDIFTIDHFVLIKDLKPRGPFH